MTLDEFEAWLDQHQENWRSSDDDIWPEQQKGELTPDLPDSYRELLHRVGALWLYRYIFLGEKGIADRTAFIHSLSQSNNGIRLDHLTAFCCMSSSHNYLCFDGELVVEFDPQKTNAPIRDVAASFLEFLSELVKNDGETFWIASAS